MVAVIEKRQYEAALHGKAHIVHANKPTENKHNGTES